MFSIFFRTSYSCRMSMIPKKYLYKENKKNKKRIKKKDQEVGEEGEEGEGRRRETG